MSMIIIVVIVAVIGIGLYFYSKKSSQTPSSLPINSTAPAITSSIGTTVIIPTSTVSSGLSGPGSQVVASNVATGTVAASGGGLVLSAAASTSLIECTATDIIASSTPAPTSGDILQYEYNGTGEIYTVSPGQPNPYASQLGQGTNQYTYLGTNTVQEGSSVSTGTAYAAAQASVVAQSTASNVTNNVAAASNTLTGSSVLETPVLPVSVVALYNTYQAGGSLTIAQYSTLESYGLYP